MFKCLITDNVLMAFETMHHISQKKNEKVGEMSLKLDISKAYDRVEWGCLEKIMLKVGFNTHWVDLMMRCVHSITYAVKINGKPRAVIIPTLGLCQGDTLSPYLFLFYAEGLSTLIRKLMEHGVIKGIATCVTSSSISHLFFADKMSKMRSRIDLE